MSIMFGVLIPFLGTTLGAACVFFMRKEINAQLEKSLLGFASGVMVAASVWSLLIPSINMSEKLGKFSFVPAVSGFLLGIAFLLLLDRFIPHLHLGEKKPEGLKSSLKKTTMLVLAVTIHNIPEGMAVGVVFGSLLAGGSDITLAGAFALAVGIAIQNFPEGAIVSMPLKSEGKSRMWAFLVGTFSGFVELLGAVFTILLTEAVQPYIPYLLSFAAGAMIYVVVEELVPEASEGEHSDFGTVGFAVGFAIMMVLDVALG